MIRNLLFVFLLASLNAFAETADTIRQVMLNEVNVVSALKDYGTLRQMPASVSCISQDQMKYQHITSLKEIGNITPNLFIPDYGSRLTNAMYIRGIGSRINTPAVGLYVDNVPYVDKSAFDFNFYDIERIDVLRGPQGTLYGRNTMGGLVRVYTKNPFFYEGTNVNFGFSSGDKHRDISLTHYHRVSDYLAFSAGGYYEGSDGFFKNSFTDKKTDALQAGGGRLRAIWKPDTRLSFDLTASYDYTDEGAYPYFYTGTKSGAEPYPDLIGKISNNRESSYRRGMLNVGLNVEYLAENWKMNSVTAYQNINDRMFMDQDFIRPDIYTLQQRQKINTVSEELIFRNTTQSRWQWITGANIMYQALNTDAPVVFYADGLRWLETTINRNMPKVSTIPFLANMGFTGMNINLRGDNLQLGSTFDTPTFNAALFHQSSLRLSDRLTASLALRLDYERLQMDYDAPAAVDYGFLLANPTVQMMQVNLQNLASQIDGYNGSVSKNRVSLLPKVSVKYDFNDDSNVFFSVAQGHRSGGYNIQMISDLMQVAMKNEMMKGVQVGVENYLMDFEKKGMPSSVIGKITSAMKDNMPISDNPEISQLEYSPERSWNYELGTHLSFGTREKGLMLDAALFYNRIYNQQISRFSAMGLGRMMVNAGKSHSCGGELSVNWRPIVGLALTGNYGFTNARFDEYDDGTGADYSGKYVPFVPLHTMNIGAQYTLNLSSPGSESSEWKHYSVVFGADLSGAGRIHWNESNEASEPFHALLGAHFGIASQHVSFTLWAKNLTSRRYNTFYFESVGRGFEQHCKPLQVGVQLALNF